MVSVTASAQRNDLTRDHGWGASGERTYEAEGLVSPVALQPLTLQLLNGSPR